MNFFRDPIWGFAQFVVATLDFLRGIVSSYKSRPEADQQKSATKSEPIVEKITEWRFLTLVLLMLSDTYLLRAFIVRVFAPGVPFDSNSLFYGILYCLDILIVTSMLYGRILLPIFLLLQFSVVCFLTTIIMPALHFGEVISSYIILPEDFKISNDMGVLIIFLVSYFTIFVLTVPLYLRNRKVWASPVLAKKTKESTKHV